MSTLTVYELYIYIYMLIYEILETVPWLSEKGSVQENKETILLRGWDFSIMFCSYSYNAHSNLILHSMERNLHRRNCRLGRKGKWGNQAGSWTVRWWTGTYIWMRRTQGCQVSEGRHFVGLKICLRWLKFSNEWSGEIVTIISKILV